MKDSEVGRALGSAATPELTDDAVEEKKPLIAVIACCMVAFGSMLVEVEEAP